MWQLFSLKSQNIDISPYIFGLKMYTMYILKRSLS